MIRRATASAATLSLFPVLDAAHAAARARIERGLVHRARSLGVVGSILESKATHEAQDAEEEGRAPRPVATFAEVVHELRLLRRRHRAEDRIKAAHRRWCRAMGHRVSVEEDFDELEHDGDGDGPRPRLRYTEPSPEHRAWWFEEVRACEAHERALVAEAREHELRVFRARACRWFELHGDIE